MLLIRLEASLKRGFTFNLSPMLCLAGVYYHAACWNTLAITEIIKLKKPKTLTVCIQLPKNVLNSFSMANHWTLAFSQGCLDQVPGVELGHPQGPAF
jgi:hypothetical protein